jgi:hypothetical protein
MRLENTIEHILLQTPTDEYWTPGSTRKNAGR